MRKKTATGLQVWLQVSALKFPIGGNVPVLPKLVSFWVFSYFLKMFLKLYSNLF